MTRRKEAPLDPFKRAVTLTTRSIAADSAMEVVFTSEPPGLTGKMARLPEPSRVPTKSEIAVIRGHADAAALSVACHNPVLHAALAPQGGEAREVFEAIEQARVEAIGANACSASRPISPPAWSSAMSGAASPRRPSAPKRRFPMRSRFLSARGSPARRRRQRRAPRSIFGGNGSRDGPGA